MSAIHVKEASQNHIYEGLQVGVEQTQDFPNRLGALRSQTRLCKIDTRDSVNIISC